MFLRTFSQAALAVVLSTGMLIGCGQNADEDPQPTGGQTPPSSGGSSEHADPHDVPLTEAEIAQLKADTADYKAAIEHIQQYQQTIERETTGGDAAHAHRALDNLDVVLERLPEAAQESGVPRARWQEVNETAQKLRDLFNEVHARIDAGEAPDYAAVADEIDQGIHALAAIEPEQAQ
jgi:hypothetical protein